MTLKERKKEKRKKEKKECCNEMTFNERKKERKKNCQEMMVSKVSSNSSRAITSTFEQITLGKL